MKRLYIAKPGNWYHPEIIAVPEIERALSGEMTSEAIHEAVIDGWACFTGIPNSDPKFSDEAHATAVCDQELCSLEEFDVIEVEDNVYEAVLKTIDEFIERYVNLRDKS